jgi:hypothetical protein
MKKMMFIFLLLFFQGCLQAPDPGKVKARSQVLARPEILEEGRLPLKIKKNYIPSPEILNLFFWPDVEKREQIKIAAKVTQWGLEIEDIYKEIDIYSYEISRIERKIQVEEELRDQKSRQVFKNYICYWDAHSHSCKTEGEGEFHVPETCDDLEWEPWSSEVLYQDCESRLAEAVFDHEVKLEELYEQRVPYDEDILLKLEKVTKRADKIISLLEKDERPDRWQNWIETNAKNSSIKLFDGIRLPELNLLIRINNTPPGEINDFVSYRFVPGAQDNDIIELDRYFDGPIPTLKFKILEKRFGIHGAKRTGFYYKVVLTQTEKKYGIDLVGTIKKYDSADRLMAKGMMKIYLAQKY